MGRPFIDITNERFGKLLAIQYVGKDEKSKDKYRLWLCQCDCGQQKIVRYRDLVRKHTTSCGCIAHEGLIGGGHNKLDYGEARFNDLYLLYRRSASSRKLEFTLSRERFRALTKGDCFYCGLPPSQVISAGKSQQVNGEYIYNGIDRIDNILGYIEGNVRSCCKQCNIAKGILSEQEFLAWLYRAAAYTAARQARFEHK